MVGNVCFKINWLKSVDLASRTLLGHSIQRSIAYQATIIQKSDQSMPWFLQTRHARFRNLRQNRFPSEETGFENKEPPNQTFIKNNNDYNTCENKIRSQTQPNGKINVQTVPVLADSIEQELATRKPKKQDVSNPIFTPASPEDYNDVARELKPTYNFAAYVNESETLQQLVKLGVDLSKIERKRELAQYVLGLNFQQDVAPYIQFLHDHGVAADDLGHVLTKAIYICQQSLEDLQVRINYLESKKFTKEEIAAIITRNPVWLCMSVSFIDQRLGWLQKNFSLTGDDVRLVVNLLPQIVTYRIQSLQLNMFVLEEEMGMTKGMIRKLLKTRPRVFIKNQKKLLNSFELVHNTMKVPVDLICKQPDILMERSHIIKERHLFLASLGRAQYNPRLPGYVSLDSLIKTDDVQFCTELALSSVESFNLFLKTL